MEKVIQLQDLQPGTSYLIRARAINKFGVVSEWSQTFTLNVINDDLKPSIPAAPTIQIAGPQKIVVSHDNTKDGGGDLEYDIAAYKVFENAVDNNTTGTLIHTMSATRPGSGLDSFATVNVDVKDSDPSATRYYYVTAVDVAGNESDPSPTATGVNITFFESAYISDLTADKIKTGTLQANESISVGTLSPIIIKSNASSPRGQIYIGAGNYAQSDTAFYVDSTGKFSLKDALTWDGTELSISGYLSVGGAEGDITTISGNKVRTGNLISNNYQSNTGSPTEQSTTFTNAGTWIDLDTGAFYSQGFYITGAGDVDPLGNPIDPGTAVFKGDIFGARGIFSGNAVDPDTYENPDGTRTPTISIKSNNTDNGYLVFFKDIGTDAGMEFYVKQGNGTNWRRGSLAHLDDVPGGFLRLGAFPSSSDVTPGRIRIFAQDTPLGKKGEIYLDASRTYAQRLFINAPELLPDGSYDWTNDPITNFWKDPDPLSNGSTYFLVGQASGSSIEVKKTSSVTSKVKITDYDIAGISRIVENSQVTIEDVSTGIDNIRIGRDVGGNGRHGFAINSNNYWTLNDGGSRAQFRVGGTNKYLLYDQLTDTLTLSGTLSGVDGTFTGTLQGGTIRTGTTSENRVEITGGSNKDRISFPLVKATDGFTNLSPAETVPAYIRIEPVEAGLSIDRVLEISSPTVFDSTIGGNWPRTKLFLRSGLSGTPSTVSTIWMYAPKITMSSTDPDGNSDFGYPLTLKIDVNYRSVGSGSPVWVLGSTTEPGNVQNAEWYPIDDLGGGGGTSFDIGKGLYLDTSPDPDVLNNTGYRNAGSSGGGTPPNSGNKITYSTGSPPTSNRQDGDLHFTYIV